MRYTSLILGLITILSFSNSYASQFQKVESNFIITDYAKTKYPIVFNHGMFGFTRLGFKNLGMDYFYQILPDLARNGAKVYATQVSPLESTEFRGEQLLEQVEEILAVTGAKKVNLVGHSHGGPTIRYIEIVAPEKVASLTAVGGAFKGSKVGDNMLSNNKSKLLMTIFGEHIIAPLEIILEGNLSLPINLDNSLHSLSEKGSAEFNAKYPSAAIPENCNSKGQKITANGVHHYSWTGTAQFTNALDAIDIAVSTIGPAVYDNRDNDGLVARCSTLYGQVIRDNYNQTHLDEVNLMFGLTSILGPDAVALYRQQANRLKLEGL
jgi:triacylglycerol lipase